MDDVNLFLYFLKFTVSVNLYHDNNPFADVGRQILFCAFFFLFIIYLNFTLDNKEFVKIKESMVCFPGYPVSTPWQSNKQIRIEQ